MENMAGEIMHRRNRHESHRSHSVIAPMMDKISKQHLNIIMVWLRAEGTKHGSIVCMHARIFMYFQNSSLIVQYETVFPNYSSWYFLAS